MSNQRYSQLIADLRGEYRPQREWGEGRGILLVVGHFLVGVAGGTWLLSWVYGVTAGLLTALVLGGLGGLVHLAFLGRPERALKMIRHWRTSWISRGFVGLSVFLAGGAVHLALEVTAPGSLPTVIASLVALAGTLVIIGYMGFTYTASKGVPFWNSPLHPVLYIAYALRGGIAMLLVLAALGAADGGDGLIRLWTGVTLLVALLFGLELQGAVAGGDAAARRSVHDILAGRLAVIFYGGTLAVGLAVPLLLGMAAGDYPVIMALVGLTSAAGDFFMKLSTVRAGIYRPLIIPRQRHRA